MKRNLFMLVSMFLASLSLSPSAFAQDTSIPPFVSTGSVQPNVLFILDNSGSMNEFAYKEVSGSRDGSTAWTGYNEGNKYYGLFDPDRSYKYDNTEHYFYDAGPVVDDPATAGVTERAVCLADNCTVRWFSGNWLNWWTMRRFDVAKKVLTGGRLGYETDEYVLIGSPFDRDSRRIFNDYASSDTPGGSHIVPASKNVYYTPFRRAIYSYFMNEDLPLREGQFVPHFNIVTARYTAENTVTAYTNESPDGDSYPGNDAVYENPAENGDSYYDYYVAVKFGTAGTDDPPASVVQNVSEQVRLGYMQFNYGIGPGEGYTKGNYAGSWDIDGDGSSDLTWRYADGGRVINPVGDDSTRTSEQGDTQLNVVHNINEQMIEMNTPITEVLNEAARYFRQDNPCYCNGDCAHTENGGYNYLVNNDWDPFYFSAGNEEAECAQSYIILVTDGESNSNSGQHSCGSLNEDFTGDGSDYLDDLAFNLRTVDQRSDIDNIDINNDGTPEMIQNITLYTVFTFDDSENARAELMRAARAGGFVDLDGDGEPYCDADCKTDDIPFDAGSCGDPATCPDGCHEWDANCDGVPDNYFEAQDGYQLETQLTGIFSAITTRGSAGAVATVSQEVVGEDIIVRGAFEAFDANDPSTFVWRGHVELFEPYDLCSVHADESSCNSSTVDNCTWINNECQQADGLVTYGFIEHPGQFCIEHDDHCWEAEDKLPLPADREIFTYLDGSKKDFTIANMCAGDDWLELDTDSYYAASDCDELVSWIRGSSLSDLSPWSKARDRDWEGEEWVLGDVAYSTPVLVGSPSLGSVSEKAWEGGACSTDNFTCSGACGKTYFPCYRENLRYRNKMIYVGANDGMLHAFLAGVYYIDNVTGDGDGDGVADESRWIYDPDETDCDGSCPAEIASIGKELWAYIPSNLLSELKEVARPNYGTDLGVDHRYMVDLSPDVWDVFIDHDGDGDREWRSVLLGGERGGGDTYFAIDVTDPDAPQVLWEYPVLRNMVVYDNSTAQFNTPFRRKSDYDSVKMLPASYSKPYVGKLMMADPDGSGFRFAFKSLPPLSPTDNRTIDNVTGLEESADFQDWSYRYESESACGLADNCTGNYIAFAGNGIHWYESDNLTVGAMMPRIHAIDIESGVDVFQLLWPKIHAQWGDQWPVRQRTSSTEIPYSMSSPLAIDVSTPDASEIEGKAALDGYVDQLYTGDLYGNFYSVKFNTDPHRTSDLGMEVTVRKTKEIDTTDFASNLFRYERQPVTVPPVSAYDDDFNIRIYFGSGKYQDVADKEDTSTMSFYNLTESDKLPQNLSSGSVSMGSSHPFNVNVQWAGDCDNAFESGCKWVESDNVTADCCQSACATTVDNASACWSCVLDLATESERVVDSALVAGGLVFFTTFVPNVQVCNSGGNGFLYVLDYMCRPMDPQVLQELIDSTGFDEAATAITQKETWNNATYKVQDGGQAFVAKIGPGVPSRPVLDSSGDYIFIQTSDATIHRIGVVLKNPKVSVSGWKSHDGV